MAGKFAKEIKARLSDAIQWLPDDFYSSFRYVDTGNNRCHSSTVWLLSNIVAALDGVMHIGIDVPLNRNNVKMKPDVVGYDNDWNHIVYVDFESPNSSDTRVICKDVAPYVVWRDANEEIAAPYVIVTSLPDCSCPKWQLRWTGMTSKGPQYNFDCRGKVADVRKNPFCFWRNRWREMVEDIDMSGAAILNIDHRKSVKSVRL